MQQPPILVTGATGFIGRTLVSLLVQQGFPVTVLMREAYAHADGQMWPTELLAVRNRLQVVYADLRNFQLAVRAIRTAEPHVVVHLAAAGVTDPFLSVDTALRHNVNGTLNLVRACFEKSTTTRRLIVARTPGERASMNVYAASKAAAWHFCQMYSRTHGWPIYGAMIFQAYGPGQSPHNLIPAALAAAQAGQDFPMTAGAQQRDWIYLSDAVAGIQAMLAADLTPGETVELGSGQLTSVVEVVDLIYRLANKGGKPHIGALPSRPGEEAVQMADAARTHARIGWQTAVSLADGVQRMMVAS